MSHYSVKNILLVLQPSYVLAILLAGIAFAACGILFLMPISLFIKILTILFVVIYTIYYLARDVLLWLPMSILSVEVDKHGECQVLRKNGTQDSAIVLPDTFVTSYLTVLNLKIESNFWRQYVVITPDRVDANAFRHLRVYLCWGKVGEPRASKEEELENSPDF